MQLAKFSLISLKGGADGNHAPGPLNLSITGGNSAVYMRPHFGDVRTASELPAVYFNIPKDIFPLGVSISPGRKMKSYAHEYVN